MKTKEELEQLKNEFKELNEKLLELSEEELKEVCGGMNDVVSIDGTVGGINNHDEQILTSTIWDIAVKLKDKIK